MKVKMFRQSKADGIRRPKSCCPGEEQRYATPNEERGCVVLGTVLGGSKDGGELMAEVREASNRR